MRQVATDIYRFHYVMPWLLENNYIRIGSGGLTVVSTAELFDEDFEHYVQAPYVIDIDDNFLDLPEHLLKQETIWKVDHLPRHLAGARVVTCASLGLADELGKKGYPAIYVPSVVSDYAPVGEAEQFIVAWRGTYGWLRALEATRPHWPSDLVLWTKANVMEDWPHRKDWTKPGGQFELELMRFQRSVDLCVSYDAPYERSKSPIKMYQAMAQSVPAVVPRLEPYGPEAAEALVYDKPEQICELVDKLRGDPGLRSRVGQAGKAWVASERNVEVVAKKFVEAWLCA